MWQKFLKWIPSRDSHCRGENIIRRLGSALATTYDNQPLSDTAQTRLRRLWCLCSVVKKKSRGKRITRTHRKPRSPAFCFWNFVNQPESRSMIKSNSAVFSLVSRSKPKTVSQECFDTRHRTLVFPEWGRYNYPHSGVHPRKLTCQRKTHHLKMHSLWKIGILQCQCHLSFQGCDSWPEIHPLLGNPNEFQPLWILIIERNSTDSPGANPGIRRDRKSVV